MQFKTFESYILLLLKKIRLLLLLLLFINVSMYLAFTTNWGHKNNNYK